MFNITHLIDLYESKKHFHASFLALSITEATRLIRLGFFPPKLTKKFYCLVSVFCVDKIYLFEPKAVKLKDLFHVVTLLDDISKYRKIIKYYENEILRSGNRFLIAKCECGVDDNEELLEYCTDGEVINRMVASPNIRIRLYKKRSLSVNVLKEMYYKHYIFPMNKGIVSLQMNDVNFFVDVLSSTDEDDEILFLMLETNERILDSEEVKKAVLDKIKKGKNIDVLKYYVKHYSIDTEKLSVFYNIFFVERDVISEYNMRDESLKIICKYITDYSESIDTIVSLLITTENYSLLASIFFYIPEKYHSENLYMNIVRYAKDNKPKIIDFKPLYLSECILVMCYLRGYKDIVDFLYSMDLNVLVKNRINPFHEYTFSTNWFNKNTRLVTLYVSFYFTDPVMMRKLLFEYPLCDDSLIVAVSEIKKAYEQIDTDYTIDYTEIEILDLPIYFRIPTKRAISFEEFDSSIAFNSNKNYNFKLISQLLKYDILQSVKIENLYHFQSIDKHYLCFNIISRYSVDDEVTRLIQQIGDISRSIRYGFVYHTKRYFGDWLPSLNYSRLLDSYQYNGPSQVLSWKIDKLDLKKFVKYKDLSVTFAKKYNLDYLPLKEEALYSCIYSYILVYILIGSVTYVERENIYSFITNIIKSFLEGLEINTETDFITTKVINEVATLKDQTESKRILDSNRPIHLLDTCKCVCAFISRNGKKASNML
ncbi:ORF-59 [Teiidae poxvirus 1]|nr:ORF-59 [Teiidae poxvirus 1]